MENSAGGRLGGQGCGAPPSGSLPASVLPALGSSALCLQVDGACGHLDERVPHTQPPGPQRGFRVRSQKSEYRSDIQGPHRKP